MASSLTPTKNSEPIMPRISARGFETIAKNLNLNRMQGNSLNEIINLNLNEKFSLANNFNAAQGSTSSKIYNSPLNEINNSIETIDDYSSPSKSSPGSQIQQNAANFYDDYKDEDEEQEADKQATKLFVGNLPIGTTLSELLPVFKKFGPVDEQLSAVKHRDHYAFINFYHRKDAQLALQEVNNSLFQDRYLRVQFSHSKHHYKRSTCNLNLFFEKFKTLLKMYRPFVKLYQAKMSKLREGFLKTEKLRQDSSDSQSELLKYTKGDHTNTQQFPCTSYASSNTSINLNDSLSKHHSSIYSNNGNKINVNQSASKFYRPIVGKKLNHSQSFSMPSFENSINTNSTSNRTIQQMRNSLIDKINLNEYNQSNFQREQILKQIKHLELQLELQKQQNESVQRLQQSSFLLNQKLIQQQQLQHHHQLQLQQQQQQQLQQLPQPITNNRQFQQQINRSFNPRKQYQFPKSNSSGNINCNDFSIVNNDQLCRLIGQNLTEDCLFSQQNPNANNKNPMLNSQLKYNGDQC